MERPYAHQAETCGRRDSTAERIVVVEDTGFAAHIGALSRRAQTHYLCGFDAEWVVNTQVFVSAGIELYDSADMNGC
jgi:hypothetical protein